MWFVCITMDIIMKYRIRKVETDKNVLYYPEELWFRVLWWEFWSSILTDYDAPRICSSYEGARDVIAQRIEEVKSEKPYKCYSNKETIIPYE